LFCPCITPGPAAPIITSPVPLGLSCILPLAFVLLMVLPDKDMLPPETETDAVIEPVTANAVPLNVKFALSTSSPEVLAYTTLPEVKSDTAKLFKVVPVDNIVPVVTPSTTTAMLPVPASVTVTELLPCVI